MADHNVLSDIAAQLSTQISFSNELMAQVQSLETQHGAHQRAAAASAASLRAATAAGDAARAEAADLRAKLAQSTVRARARLPQSVMPRGRPPPLAHK